MVLIVNLGLKNQHYVIVVLSEMEIQTTIILLMHVYHVMQDSIQQPTDQAFVSLVLQDMYVLVKLLLKLQLTSLLRMVTNAQ